MTFAREHARWVALQRKVKRRARPAALAQVKPPPADIKANLPNAVTLASFVLGAWWTAGGPDWSALASIVLDELDGRLARSNGQESDFGSLFDWSSDVVLTAGALVRAGAPWPAVPAVATVQTALRAKGFRPPVLSARALVMLADIARRRVL